MQAFKIGLAEFAFVSCYEVIQRAMYFDFKILCESNVAFNDTPH